MPLKTTDLVVKSVNTVAIPSAKRRRSDSISNHQETCENSTLTLDQLRLQYGNMSVRMKVVLLIFNLKIILF